MLAFMVFLPVFSSGQAQAYDFNEPEFGYDRASNTWNGEVCPGDGNGGLLRRVMPCIKETLINLTNDMMQGVISYIDQTVTIVCAFAILLLGKNLIGGKTTAPFRDTLVLMAKLGAISLFMWEYSAIFGKIFDIIDGMLDIVTNYVLVELIDTSSTLSCLDYTKVQDTPLRNSVWDAADCAINILVGGIMMPANVTIGMGIVGFLVSALFSNPIGMAIGLIGIRIILQLIWALFRCLYVYLGCYIGICLLVLIAPFIIPTILFQATRSYFERWLRILMSFILQPIVLFAYMGMLLAAFDTVILTGPHSLYMVLVGPVVNDPKFNVPVEMGGLGGIGTVLKGGGYQMDYKASRGAIIDSQREEQVIDQRSDPKSKKSDMNRGVVDTGITGLVSGILKDADRRGTGLSVTENKQRKVLRNLGLGRLSNLGGSGNDLNILEYSIPTETVDWAFLARNNGYTVDTKADPRGAEISVIHYLIKVYISFLMALITGFVFIELLDKLPFIGQGLALGSGLVDEKSLGITGIAKLTPPGADFMKHIRGKSFVG